MEYIIIYRGGNPGQRRPRPRLRFLAEQLAPTCELKTAIRFAATAGQAEEDFKRNNPEAYIEAVIPKSIHDPDGAIAVQTIEEEKRANEVRRVGPTLEDLQNRAIIDGLISDFDGKIMPFARLPTLAQVAMAFYEDEPDVWEWPVEVQDAHREAADARDSLDKERNNWNPRDFQPVEQAVIATLPICVQRWGEREFGYVRAIPTTVLSDAYFQAYNNGVKVDGTFATFDAYHRHFMRYMSREDHGDSVWPMILGRGDDWGLFQYGQGWFHSCIERNIEQLPCVYYPTAAKDAGLADGEDE